MKSILHIFLLDATICNKQWWHNCIKWGSVPAIALTEVFHSHCCPKRENTKVAVNLIVVRTLSLIPPWFPYQCQRKLHRTVSHMRNLEGKWPSQVFLWVYCRVQALGRHSKYMSFSWVTHKSLYSKGTKGCPVTPVRKLHAVIFYVVPSEHILFNSFSEE